MCKYASFVLTENECYYARGSSSHEDIIAEHKLREGPAARPNILRVEISPSKKWADLKSWAYKVDQDIMPAWYDAEKCEQRTRMALAKMLHGAKWPKRLDAFLGNVKQIPWFKPDGKPLKSWRLYESEKGWAAARAAAGDAARAAAGAAAGDAARDAAWDAAWDAAMAAARAAAWAAAGAAAWAAAGDAARAAAGDAVRATVGDAAWAAARAAAGAAARAAAGDAAGDAALSIFALDIPAMRRKHIQAHWRVWKKGYALLCDVNGVLYVYAAKKQ